MIQPHSLDPTGQPIHVAGTLDQIREIDSQLFVLDIKTGKPSGLDMMNSYLYQQLAYTLGAKQSGHDVRGAYLLRTYGYRVRNANLPSPDGVFWLLPFEMRDVELLLERVAFNVAMIRRGEAQFGPGPACSFCPSRSISSCLPKAKARFSLDVV